MTELDELLVATLREGDRALAGVRLGDDEVAVLQGRIAARRDRRRVLQGVAAAPLVVGLAVGGWALGGVVHGGPVASTGPVASPVTSPATPEPSATGDGSVPDADLGLPPTVPLPPGVLEQAGPGWVLGLYQPDTDAAYASAGAVVPPVRQTVVLAAPDGTVYRVVDLDLTADLPPGAAYRSVRLLDWRPGATTALVQAWTMPIGLTEGQGDVSVYAPVYDLDLSTGALTLSPDDLGWPAGPGEGSAPFVAVVAQGHPVWVVPSSGTGARLEYQGHSTELPSGNGDYFVSPDGSSLLTGGTVVDLATMAPVDALPAEGAAGQCLPLSWWSADEVLARCSDGDPYADSGRGESRWVSFRVGELGGAGTVVRQAVDDPLPDPGGALLADHRVAFAGQDVAHGWERGLWTLVDGDLSVLAPPADSAGWAVMGPAPGLAVRGTPDRVLVPTLPVGSTLLRLVAIDPSGAVTTVLGVPGGTPPDGSARWADGLTSWVVGR